MSSQKKEAEEVIIYPANGLAVNFIGIPNVVNDGKTASTLKIALTNNNFFDGTAEESNIVFTRETPLYIKVLTDLKDGTDKDVRFWALMEATTFQQGTVKLSVTKAPGSFSVQKITTSTPKNPATNGLLGWKITPNDQSVTLLPGRSITLTLEGIVTDLEDGPTPAYCTVQMKNNRRGRVRDVFTLQAGSIMKSSDVTIHGDAQISNDLKVKEDTKVGMDLTVGGDGEITNDLNIGGGVKMTNDLSVGGNGTVTDDLSVGGDGTIKKDLSVGGDGTITKDLTVNQKLVVEMDTELHGDVGVNGDIHLVNDLDLGGIIKFKGSQAPIKFETWDELEQGVTPTQIPYYDYMAFIGGFHSDNYDLNESKAFSWTMRMVQNPNAPGFWAIKIDLPAHTHKGTWTVEVIAIHRNLIE